MKFGPVLEKARDNTSSKSGDRIAGLFISLSTSTTKLFEFMSHPYFRGGYPAP